MHTSIRRALALAALVLAVPATAHAQFERNTKLGVFAGATVPTGDLGDFANTGYNLGALIEIKPTLSPVGIRFDGMFNRFGWKDVGGNGTVWALNANAVLSPASSPLYLIGGLGLYSGNSTTETIGTTQRFETGTKLGFNGGAGLRIPLTGFDTFIEARYHYVRADNETNDAATTMIPISFGVRF